ncbi:MAG: GntR family transcriptional regulator [Planctomycetota bacterium]
MITTDITVQRPKTLKEQSYQQIRDLLRSGELIHSQLYSANELAERLHVSRTPVREALLQLESEGLLVQFDGRGFQPKHHTEKDARDFFAIRKLFELFALKDMAAHARAHDLELLAEHLEAMRLAAKTDNHDAFIRADENFHLVIVRGCGNALVESFWCNIRDLISVFGRQALLQPQRMDEAIAEHSAILAALRRLDASTAVAALQSHLDATQSRLVEAFPS